MSAGRRRDGGAARPLEARIASTLRRARLAIGWERLWPRLAPLVGVVLVFLAVSFGGLWRLVDGWAHIALLAGFGLLALLTLLPLRGLRSVAPDEARRRVEERSALAHAPLRSLEDEIGTLDGAAGEGGALWRAHRERLQARLAGLRAGRASPRLDRRDPYALRGAVLLIFGVAALAGWGEWGLRVADAFAVSRTATPAQPVRIDAWISPPAYTGRAPLVITDVAGSISVPEGSVATVRSVADIAVAFEGEGEPAPLEAESTPGGLAGFEGRIDAGGRLVVRVGDEERRAWTIDVVPDEAPTIAFIDPGLAVAERREGLRLTYEMADDYGIVSAEARVSPVEPASAFPWARADRADPRPLYDVDPIRLALPRGAKGGTGQTVRDLSEHPYAGTRVAVVLEAMDAASQTARSAPREIVLPGRTMRQPLAKAVMEQARTLARDANAAERVADLLEVLGSDPEENWGALSPYLGLRVAKARLADARSDDDLRAAVELLMAVAVGIDEGGLSAAQRDLVAAQEALKDALRNGASDEELAALMDDLRAAMQRVMEEMLANADPNAPAQPMTSPPTDLSEFMDRLEDALRSDQRDQAEQMLAQLEQMMNDLMAGRAQPQQPGGMSQQFAENMDALAEMLRRQQELMDETFQSQQQRPRDGQNGQRGERPQDGQSGSSEPMTPEEFAEAMERLQEQQQALQEALEGLAEQMEGLGMDAGELGQAGDAMGRAERQLGQGEAGRAVGPQGEALDALRQAGRSMAQQMQQMQRQLGQGQGQPGGEGRQLSRGQPFGETDPLGRPLGEEGRRFDSDVAVPGERDAQRARDILEELRRRLGDIARPRDELDYLERLLERF